MPRVGILWSSASKVRAYDEIGINAPSRQWQSARRKRVTNRDKQAVHPQSDQQPPTRFHGPQRTAPHHQDSSHRVEAAATGRRQNLAGPIALAHELTDFKSRCRHDRHVRQFDYFHRIPSVDPGRRRHHCPPRAVDKDSIVLGRTQTELASDIK